MTNLHLQLPNSLRRLYICFSLNVKWSYAAYSKIL